MYKYKLAFVYIPLFKISSVAEGLMNSCLILLFRRQSDLALCHGLGHGIVMSRKNGKG